MGVIISAPLMDVNSMMRIPKVHTALNNGSMQPMEEIHRARLLLLIREYGSQTKFAEKIGKSPSQVSQWVNASIDSKTGKPRAMNRLTAREIEMKCDKEPGWMDQPVAISAQAQTPHAKGTVVLANDTQAAYPVDQAVRVPLLGNAASMGPGADAHSEDIVAGSLTLTPSFVSNHLRPSSYDALRFIHGYGDSMEPTFSSGDVLLVDTGVTDAKIDGIYVLEAHDRLFIKRVRQRMDGSFEVSSDNPTHKTTDTLNGDHSVSVKGRVIWAWNGRKL